ncbi:MAG: cytochrome b/b6 domain-containing protein [Nevskia sp.]|nr:cytochrome b/b6 domain-containing protein [Nevskia sp.]
MSPSPRYGRPAIVLHWLVAVLMVLNVILALSADLLPEGWVRPVIDTHKSVGITVLGLALLRLLWRLSHAPPPLPAGYRSWERRTSLLVHGLLYLLMFALPLSGWLHDSAWKAAASHPMKLYGLVPWPRIGWITQLDPALKERLHDLFGGWHTALGYALYLLFGLHLAGALKHQLVDREPELQRIGL